METTNQTIPNYVEVTVSVSMSKGVMIEVPEGASHDEIIEKARKEIMLPLTVMEMAKQGFEQLGIRPYGIDFNDWNVDEVEYVTD